jgi:hypothetical protein
MDEVSGFSLVIYGTAVVLAGWTSWWAKIKALTIPSKPIAYQSLMAAGIVLIVWGMIRGAGPLGGMIGFVGLVAGGMYLWTSTMRELPKQTLAVRVGEPVLDFDASDSDGAAFSISSLSGKPFLLKFYRGHW